MMFFSRSILRVVFICASLCVYLRVSARAALIIPTGFLRFLNIAFICGPLRLHLWASARTVLIIPAGFCSFF